MCLAKLYESADGDHAVLEDIAHLRCEGDRVELVTLYGESKVVQGRISQIDFLKSRLVIASCNSPVATDGEGM